MEPSLRARRLRSPALVLAFALIGLPAAAAQDHPPGALSLHVEEFSGAILSQVWFVHGCRQDAASGPGLSRCLVELAGGDLADIRGVPQQAPVHRLNRTWWGRRRLLPTGETGSVVEAFTGRCRFLLDPAAGQLLLIRSQDPFEGLLLASRPAGRLKLELFVAAAGPADPVRVSAALLAVAERVAVSGPPSRPSVDPAALERSYFSAPLNREIAVRAFFAESALPASLMIYGDRMNGVIVERLGDRAFLLDVGRRTLPVSIDERTQRIVLKRRPHRSGLSQEDYRFEADLSPLEGWAEVGDFLIVEAVRKPDEPAELTGPDVWVADEQGSIQIERAIGFDKPMRSCFPGDA